MEHDESLCAAIEYLVPSSERSEIEVVGFPDCRTFVNSCMYILRFVKRV